MISKELLRDVLEIEISYVNIVVNNVNYTVPNYQTEEDGEIVFIDLVTNINIHELAYLCKKWAFEKHNVNIIINNSWLGVGFISIIIKRNLPINVIIYKKHILNKTSKFPFEPKYIFDACQWLLDNKE